MKVAFIIGAGFSYNAGLPLVKGISTMFLRKPLDDYALHFNSGEWKWKDWANSTEKVNGRLPGNHIPIAMFIENAIKHYCNEQGNRSM